MSRLCGHNYGMKVISTWLFDPWLDGQIRSWTHTVDMLATMRAAAGLAQRRYGNFTVYTNSRSEPWLRQILPTATVIVSHDSAHQSVPVEFYSWCKLWTWRLQNQEFLHIDLDFLFGPSWVDSPVETAILGQWWEDTSDQRARGYYNWQDLHSRLTLPPELVDLDPSAPAINTGCLAVRDLKFINTYVTAVEQLIDTNPGLFAEHLSITVPTIEQHLLGMLLHKHNIPTNVLIQPNQAYEPINNQFIHFLGVRWKNRNLPLANSVLSQTIDTWITPELHGIAGKLDQQIA